MFNRPATVQTGSYTDSVMTTMEAGFVAGDKAAVEKGYLYLLANMPSINCKSAIDQANAMTDYLEQFEEIFA